MGGIISLLVKVRNSGLLSIKFLCVTLWHMSIGAGVVVAIALQQVDGAPHAEAGAEGDHKGLENVYRGVEKIHNLSSLK